MNALIELIRDLCLFRRGPQDVPHSPSLLGGLVVASFVLDLALMTRLESFGAAFVRVVIGLVAALVLPQIALKLAKLEARWVQTASALLAASIAFTLLSIPILLGVGKMPEKPEDVTAAQFMLTWVALFVSAWQLAVRGHILRHALNLPLRLGVLVAVIFFAIEIFVTFLVFGREASA
jgi:hypothetical protein